MNNSIKLAFVAALAVAGIAACTSTPVVENNAAPQTSSTPTSESPAPPVVVTEVVTSTVTNPPKRQAAVTKTDDRIGYGALKLGMSLDEARAAGLTTLAFESDRGNECVSDDKIAVSRRFGIERISLPLDARTSEGIGVGSTFGDVKKAYPTATEYRAGLSARINDHAFYSFNGEPGSDASKVVAIKLGARDVYCSMAEL